MAERSNTPDRSYSWKIFRGSGEPHDEIAKRPDPPPWRRFPRPLGDDSRGKDYHIYDPGLIDVVNAALLLRRPLFVTGKPGIGKSTLAHAVAHELTLERVLYWPINTKTTLHDGLYHYDAIGRLQAASLAKHRAKDGDGYQEPDIGDYIRLGPLGTALASKGKPRVLLIDEIDKSELDLPNDLLHVLEEGEFAIPELARAGKTRSFDVQRDARDSDETVTITGGKVRCEQFPFILMTSNGERDFPAPFFRRCLRYDLKPPTRESLENIVRKRFAEDAAASADLDSFMERIAPLIDEYGTKSRNEDLAVDQLLNAAYLISREVRLFGDEKAASSTDTEDPAEALRKILFRSLTRQL